MVGIVRQNAGNPEQSAGRGDARGGRLKKRLRAQGGDPVSKGGERGLHPLPRFRPALRADGRPVGDIGVLALEKMHRPVRPRPHMEHDLPDRALVGRGLPRRLLRLNVVESLSKRRDPGLRIHDITVHRGKGREKLWPVFFHGVHCARKVTKKRVRSIAAG